MKSSLNSEWGTLFGLSPKDLTEEQLQKLDFNKLIEFVSEDPRVEKILQHQMFLAPIKELARISDVKDDIKSRAEFLSHYNNCLRSRRDEIDKNNDYYYYGRAKMVLWEFLDDNNKEYEFKRWLNGFSSVLNEDSLDYNWLYSRDKETADSVVKKILDRSRNYSANTATKNVIENLPKDDYLRWLPYIFGKDKYVFIHSLSNPHTPKDYVLKALRVVAKLTHPPKVTVKIDNATLNELPPVTRLEVLEKIIYNSTSKEQLPFAGINNPDDLRQLVFSSLTRHYDRVNNLVERYKKIINWRDQ